MHNTLPHTQVAQSGVSETSSNHNVFNVRGGPKLCSCLSPAELKCTKPFEMIIKNK